MKKILTERNIRSILAESMLSSIPIPIIVGERKIAVEIADTSLSRDMGLMFRNHLPENGGMLFIFEDSSPRRFWMKNTQIPLSIAYANDRGVILNIENMNPMSREGVWSRGPAKYALEMNQGWFESNSIKPGDTIFV
jgi:uncharacterized membrane protein (UPF0127 family)